MSEASQGQPPASQEFERVLAAASTAQQASFEEEHLSPIKRVQRFLHVYPTVVPFVVLVLGLLLGTSVNFDRFATASNLDRTDAGDDHRYCRHRSDAGHFDGRD